MQDEERPGVSDPMEVADPPVLTSVVGRSRVQSQVDPEFITGSFDAHAGRLRAFALNAVRDAATADDLVQESFLRLIEQARSGTKPENVRGWLFRVCGNLIVSRARRRSVADRMRSLLVERGTAPSAEDAIVRADEHARVRTALAALPPDARVALLMSAQGHSSAEIGQAIGRTRNATLTYLSRSRIRLRELLAETQEAGR
jgi:RNA polymerase sigma-70 factor, ECF subfamily